MMRCTLIVALLLSLNTWMPLRAGDGRFTEKLVAPVRVVWMSDSTGQYVRNAGHLLQPFSGQVAVSDKEHTTLHSDKAHTASILLDFGRELHGGLKVSAGMRQSKAAASLRITYGESVSEAMSHVGERGNAVNDHALREFTMQIPWLGSATTGYSGFRFVRIDLLDCDIDVNIAAVEAVSRMRDYDYLGEFESSDARLNDIFHTGAYTVHLNMQEYIWDGIKRDRLVWLGDLNPELLTICCVFGQQAYRLIHSSLDFGRDAYPLPQFINGMSSYSLWWIINHYDLYMYEGDLAYLREQHHYLAGLVELFCSLIDPVTGRENIPNGFLDWPTSTDAETIHAGMQALARMAMDRASRLAGYMGDRALEQKAASLCRLLDQHKPRTDNTQALSMLILGNMHDNIDAGADQILRNGLSHLSTFYGYYALKALARTGRYHTATEWISTYWGKMLELGATTFWEELEWNNTVNAARIDELVPEGKFDIHADGGQFCYVGMRASLCHGWASGPTPWLMHHILGIRPTAPGCRQLTIEPHLGKLEWAKGTFPTPLGNVRIDVRRNKKGKKLISVRAPKGIRTRVVNKEEQ